MGCIPSKSSLDIEPKPEMSIVARIMTRGSSVEIPRSPASVETKVKLENVSRSVIAPLPPRVDCIAPRPKPSEESLRRQKVNADQAHQESATTATAGAGGVGAGASVTGDTGGGAGGGGDVGGGGDGGGE